MKLFLVILLGCSLHAVSSNVSIRNNHIDEHTEIGPNVKIGENCSIGKRCTLESGVIIEDNVEIDDSCFIGYRCEIKSHVKIFPNVKIAPKTIANEHANILNQVKIGRDCILDEFSEIGSKSVIENNVYIGMGTKIGLNVTIGQNAVIYQDARIPDNTIVDKNEVIIQAPLSSSLYIDCMPFDQIAPFYIRQMTEHSSQSEFNSYMRMKLTWTWYTLDKNKQNIHPLHFKEMPLLKSLYLIQFHGMDGFKTNKQSIDSDNFGHDNPLHKERHFVNDSQKNILEADVQDKFIKLLAFGLDSQRSHRVKKGDMFMTMFMDIESGKRHVKCI